MNDKAHANQPGGTQDCENRIPGDRRSGVKWMKSNAAAVGVIYRIGEQMIEVDEHRGHHEEPGSPPLFTKEKPRHCPGNGRV